MFKNESSDVISFNSQISTAKPEVPVNIQTAEIIYSTKSAQTVEKKNAETQTLQEQKKGLQIDYDKLAQFLRKVTPNVLEALDEACNIDAFDDYNTEATINATTNIHLLKRLSIIEESIEQTKVSSISWSITGGTIIVSHSITYHETWCDHLSKIKLYNLTRDNNVADNPAKSLEVNSCITALSYHPDEPSILASASFNGDVLVWNLRDSDSVTPNQIYMHNDIVSQINWRTKIVNDASILVSCSRDGYIAVHKLMTNFTTTRLHKLLKIAKEHNPIENTRPRSAGGKRERAAEAGLCITSIDFSSKNPIVFIVGTLCGGVYRCSLDTTASIEGDETLFDPVVDEYERHNGSIICVKCSPTLNLFVTCCADKELRIYDFDQSCSQRSISLENTVVGLTWMFRNQDIFASYGAGTVVKFYNVTNGKEVTNIKLETTAKDSINSLSINPERNLLAIGDVQGNVEIWKIPPHLL